MSKLNKLRAELKKMGVDALIVLDELNQKYLSDFAFTDGLLLITEDRAELITDFRYFEMAEKSASKDYDYLFDKFASFYPIANLITYPLRGQYKIGVESDSVEDIQAFIRDEWRGRQLYYGKCAKKWSPYYCCRDEIL